MQSEKQPFKSSTASASGQSTTLSAHASQEQSFQISAPTISLPKGGGAIRGIGEKFAANPVTGTGSMTVPIATSPGRSGFGPQLSLSYDSGAGNGPFGFGWSLSLPAITRKTDKGLPKYQDAEESDVFILSGTEDLVPLLVNENGKWEREKLDPRTVGGQTYQLQRYRPRIEGLFARIERWTNINDATDVFWRSISKDNITTWYGKTDESRISDPNDKSHIFSWLICQTYDDKGNVITYRYKSENSDNVDVAQAHEKNRTDNNKVRGEEYKANRTANRYLKRICYGNREPYLPELTETGWLQPPNLNSAGGLPNYYFEVVFDYEDGHYTEPTPDAEGRIFAEAECYPPASAKWSSRVDPFSSYRAGFEVRTYRLCQRVLMFHHFPDELGTPDYLVRSTEFNYSYEKDPNDARNPIYSFLDSVSQSGYQRQGTTYLKRSLPPVEFTYSKPEVQDLVEEVDPESMENLPIGLDGTVYQWTDLHGEGIPGILTEQAGTWFYKRNWSPIPDKLPNGSEVVKAKFSALETVALKPNIALSSGAQFMDLAGDGQPDLAVLDGPMPGLSEHDLEEGWEPFRPFTSRLNRDLRDPNLKFVDLDGDGHADVLITEDEAFVWHESLAEEGFGPAQRVAQKFDEEKGPRIVFADGTQSIYLADLSGDGLTDLVRIRNGEVCYWPNLGYGRFGAKVTMDRSPLFDHPDLFDQKRVRLADINGSGTTDIIYLHRDGIRLYFNQSGNRWSQPQPLKVFPHIDDLVSIVPVDLLGNGTACLVWSSPLPSDTRHPLRYVNLMGSQKPHLLIKTVNNLGGETEVTYAPSTKFYLQDKQAGTPWITKLPFPVHCVEKITIRDKWRQTEFASTYSYHHGYFDGIEREFRGFSRVEQRDVETYGKFLQGNIASPYITDQHDLYQPPIKTVTWHHTGTALERRRILSALKQEYFTVPGFTEHELPEPTLTPADLSAEEWCEALRACKGMVLRQEVIELDVDALDQGTEKPVRLYTTAYHNSNITRVQPQGINRHAVFLVTESEAMTYNYELDLQQGAPSPDPRIAHTLNLHFDKYGRAMQSVAVNYARLVPYTDPSDLLTAEQRALIRNVQSERHIVYTETHFTDELPEDPDRHRLPAPCEVLIYELTGANSTNGFAPSSGLYFALEDLKAFSLSETLPDPGPKPVVPLAYHEQPTGDRERAHKRLVEWMRMLYFKDDLSSPEPFGTHAWLGLPYETYKLALTRDLLNAVLGAKLTADVLTSLNTAAISGYMPGTALSPSLTGQWWMRSGVAGFANDAAQHFYLPEEYTDPFGNKTTLVYDGTYDLFIQSSTDALGNSHGVAIVPPVTGKPRFDYRVLAPIELVDANGNRTEVSFDILGMVIASAVKGKGTEADHLNDYTDTFANPDLTTVLSLFDLPPLTAEQARARFSPILGHATGRFLYHFGERMENGKAVWGDRPAGACAVVRERHVASIITGEPPSPLQIAFECSDGMGTVLMKRSQAEPEQTNGSLRWIVSGKTVLNNKGKPVKQYEPYFSSTAQCCAEGDAHEEVGVTPLMYYDAAGRLVRTEMPDGTYSRVEFSPWQARTFDANDTAYDPDPINPNHSDWYRRRTDPTHPLYATFNTTEDHRAAELIKAHANTAAQVHLDSLGREVVAIAHNRTNGVDEKYLTFTKLDAEGKPLWICDARGNLVMQYITPPKPSHTPLYDQPNPDWRPVYDLPSNAVPCYDIAGNLLFQHSMDEGDRWMLMDAAGKPMLAWDMNQTPQGTTAPRENRFYRTDYDALHRPKAQWLTIDSDAPIMAERYEYQDAVPNDVNNLNAQLIRHYDPSGLVETVRRDFKGNVREIHRALTRDAMVSVVNWDVADATALNGLLEQETFVQLTEHDALNRMTRLYNWHRPVQNRLAIYLPRYNERGVLKAEDVVMRATDYDPTTGTRTTIIKDMRYNAKGQKEYLELGNGTLTQYDYDTLTFRLRQLRTTRPANRDEFPTLRSNLTNPNVIQQLFYTYDPVGNITETEDQAYKPVFFDNGIAEPKSLYEYDALYRLISATGRETAQGGDAALNGDEPAMGSGFPINDQTLRRYEQIYKYDHVGNFVTMQHRVPTDTTAGWTRGYDTHLDSNRLRRTWYGAPDWDHAATAQRTEYNYDTHGNMLNLANVAPGQHLQWDHRDMIQSLDLIGGGIAHYQYDSGKQRTRKRIVNQNGLGGYWERIFLSGYERYRRYNGGSTTPVEEIESHHLFEGEQRVLLVDDVILTNKTHADGRVYKAGPIYRYQYSNHLGSACLELDHDAEIVSYEEYHPYGTSAYRAMKSGIEAPPKRYRYTGMERDEESGLSYHWARYYTAGLGRWLSCDSTGVNDGPNVYVFVLNNPVRFADRNGNQHSPAQSEADAQTAWKLHQLKVLHGELAVEANVPLKSFQGDFAASQKVTESQKRVAPGSAAAPFVSDLDRLKAEEEARSKRQWRAAAVVAAVGITVIAPEVIVLLGLEGQSAAVVATLADIASGGLQSYGATGDPNLSTVITGVVLSRFVFGFKPPNGAAKSIVDDAARQKEAVVPAGRFPVTAAEAAVSRAESTGMNYLNQPDVSRTISTATGEETFIHTTSRAALPHTPESAAVNIADTKSLKISPGGQTGHWGEGGYAYEGTIADSSQRSLVQFKVPAGTAVERITLPGSKPIVRLVPAHGNAVPVVDPATNLSRDQLIAGFDWQQKLRSILGD